MKTHNRWVVLAACVVINLCLGAGYAWSVFQGPLVEMFGFTPAQATIAFSISFGMGLIGMILFGPLQDKKGPRRESAWPTAAPRRRRWPCFPTNGASPAG